MKKRLFFSAGFLILLIFIGIAVCVTAYVIVRPFIDLGPPFKVLYGKSLYIDDPEIGFVPRSNNDALIHYLTINNLSRAVTDDIGARVDKRGESASADVVTIGCSFAYGAGIDNADTFTSVFSKNTGLRAVNLAVSSYNTIQALLMLKKHRDLRPKVIIYGLIEAHAYRNIKPCADSFLPICLATPYIDFHENGTPFILPPVRKNSVTRTQRFIDEVTNSSFHLSQLMWAPEMVLCRYYDKYYENTKANPDKVGKAFEFAIDELVAFSKELDAKLIIVYFPYTFLGKPKEMPYALKESILKRGVLLLDTTPVIYEHMNKPSAPLLHVLDGHPNEIAHNIYALELEKLFKRERLIRTWH